VVGSLTDIPLRWRLRRRIVRWLRLGNRCSHCGGAGYVEFQECSSCGWRLLGRPKLELVREVHPDYPYWLWLTVSQGLENEELERLLEGCSGVERLSVHAMASTPRWLPLQRSFVSMHGKWDPLNEDEMPPRLEEIGEPAAAVVQRLIALRPRHIAVSITAPNGVRLPGKKRRVSPVELLRLVKDAALGLDTRYVTNARSA